ncbi:MAG: SCO family protein [Desulfuromonas sp.]|nr:SCO family protein [Desulfuromonas sp.]
MNIPTDSTRGKLLPTLVLLTVLLLPFPARSAEYRQAASDQRHQVVPPAKPSAQTTQGQLEISNKSGLLAVTEAPTDRVGIDEQLGARLPLDLNFRDEAGNLVRLRDLVTRPTVIAPVYYRCPNVCHFLQGEIAQVLPQLKLTASTDYQMLSVSFDETETPEIARRSRDTYLTAANGKVPAAGWRFLTGDLPAITALTDAAGYHFRRVGSEFQHPVAIFVVTPDGMIVRYLHGTSILPKDLALALAEAKAGVVGTTIRKMVQYCFSYDPQQKTYVFNLLRVSATVILTTLGLFLAWLLLTGKKKPKDPLS